jgi:hypothetical protein
LPAPTPPVTPMIRFSISLTCLFAGPQLSAAALRSL